MTAPSRSMIPFQFRSDFQVPDVDEVLSDGMKVSARELALLMEESREKGMAMVETARQSDADAAVADLHARLNAAMDDLVALTRYIESATETVSGPIASEVRATASRIVDGQGELFTSEKNSQKQER